MSGIRIGRILELDAEDIDFDKEEIRVFKKQRRGLTERYNVPFLFNYFKKFKNTKGKLFKDISYNSTKKYFEDLFLRLGISGITLHSFRHTFISTLYNLGLDVKTIQQWAGHNTLDITFNTYTHLIEKGDSLIKIYLKELIKKVEK